MTWRELAEQINKLPESEKDKDLAVFNSNIEDFHSNEIWLNTDKVLFADVLEFDGPFLIMED